MNSMKIAIPICLVLFSLVQHALSQQPLTEARRRMLMGSDELLAEAISIVQAKSLEELKAIVRDGSAPPGIRSASARLLLQRAEKLEDKQAALPALGINLPGGLTDTESDWTKNYPAAAEASLHPDLMGPITQYALDGSLPEAVTGFVLLRYQTDNLAPGDHLAALLKTNLTPEQRQRGERLVAVLKGETPTQQPSKEEPENKLSTIPLPPVVQPAKSKTPEAKPTASTPSKEPASSTPWSIIVVLSVAAIGLLWLLLKKSK